MKHTFHVAEDLFDQDPLPELRDFGTSFDSGLSLADSRGDGPDADPLQDDIDADLEDEDEDDDTESGEDTSGD